MNLEGFQDWMLFFALFGSLFLYVQAFKIFRTKEVAGLSELAFIITLISAIAWGVYGFLTKDNVIILSSVANAIGSILILTLIFAYRDNEPEPKVEFEKNTRSPEDIITAYNDHREPNPWFFAIDYNTKNLRFCPD